MGYVPKIKICGITNLDDALQAANVGADFLGYIFYPKSPRYVEPVAAEKIISRVRELHPHVLHTGVFVNSTAQAILSTVTTLDLVQLHGDETPEFCERLAERGLRLTKAIAVGVNAPPLDFRAYETDYYLCDTHHATLHGGTGMTFDTALLPSDLPMDRTFLAGGLTPENVGELLAVIHPFAVDVSSGVEASPGKKAPDRVDAFIKRIRNL